MQFITRFLARRSGKAVAVLAAAAALTGGTAVLVPAVANADQWTGYCDGWFDDPNSVDAFFRRDYDGRVYWDVYLAGPAAAAHAPAQTVSVTMPYAYVNGQPIVPPYAPHVENVGYNFHASAQSVALLGQGSANHLLQTGDLLTLSWFIDSPYATTFGQKSCYVGPPGL